MILCESCPKMPYVTLCTFLAHNLAAKDDHKRPKRAWRPRGFSSPKIAQGKMKGVLLGNLSGNTLFFVLCYPIAKSTCLLIFSSFCMLFLFATCHRRIHKMLKTNLIGGNYGQLFLMVQLSMPCLTTLPHVRTFSPRTGQFWGRESSLWVMPPSQ